MKKIILLLCPMWGNSWHIVIETDA